MGARSAVDSPTREALFGRIGVFAGFETNPRRGHGAGEQDVNESSPANFKAAVGETLSKFIKLQAMPKDVSDEVPAIKSYEFTILRSKLLIVDPTSKKVVDIIAR